MNKFLKAFKYASIACVLINVLCFILGASLAGVASFMSDYKKVLPIALALFFLPTFFAVVLFDSKNLSKSVLKSALVSFFFIYSVVYFFLAFFVDRQGVMFFLNTPSLFNGIIAALFATLSTLIYYVITNKTTKYRGFEKVTITIREVGIIWLGTSLFFLVLISILSKNSFPLSYFIIPALFGFIAGMIALLCVKYVIKHNLNKNTNFIIGTAYLSNIILLPILQTIILRFLNSMSNDLFPDNLSISIVIAFLRTIIMYGGYYLLITLSVHIYIIFKLNKSQKEHLKQVGVTASLKYQQLKAQLSPHFLFNNISVLTGLIEENQERAITFSEKLSNIYRYFLNHENQDLVLLKEELVFAEEYLELLQVRFEKALTYNYEVSNLEAYYILPMALQQVLENVIKHNEVSIEKPIHISLHIDDDYLIIANNLNPKLAKEKNSQTGLENIVKRYTFFTDKGVAIAKDDKYYTVKLPLLKIED